MYLDLPFALLLWTGICVSPASASHPSAILQLFSASLSQPSFPHPQIVDMGSLLGKVKLFAFVQCAVFLVFVLEVADRLMY